MEDETVVIVKSHNFPSLSGFTQHLEQSHLKSWLTYVVSGWEILVFTAGVSLFSVQQEVVDHFLLVLPAEQERKMRWANRRQC